MTRSRARFIFWLALATPVLAVGEAPLPAQDPSAWSLAANHLHSSPGGEKPWASGIKHIAKWCERNDVAFAALTDHNTIEGWFLPEFTANPKVVMLRGEEWTSPRGHANLIEYSADKPEDVILPGVSGDCKLDEDGHHVPGPAPSEPVNIDHAAMIKQVHARGGLVIINHPGLPLYPWPEADHGADACEVGRNFLDFRGRRSLAWWIRRLEEGSHIGAAAGSDYHFLRPKKAIEELDAVDLKGPIFTPAIDTPINLILAPTKDAAGFRAAILARHVQVLRTRKAPRIFVDVRSGTGPAGTMGDVIAAPAGAPVKLTVRVMGGKKQVLEILESEQGGSETTRKVTEVTIDTDDFTHSEERSGSGDSSHFVIFSVADLESLTNPVWY